MAEKGFLWLWNFRFNIWGNEVLSPEKTMMKDCRGYIARLETSPIGTGSKYLSVC